MTAAKQKKDEAVPTPQTSVPSSRVVVDNRTRRSDDDAIEGSFVRIVEGEHAGRVGAFEQVTEHSKKDGYPVTILVRTRDAQSEYLTVPYADVRPADPYHGGR